MPKMEVKVYDESEIQDWNIKTKSLPLEIENLQKNIEEENTKLAGLQNELLQINKALEPIDKVIENIDAQLHVLSLPSQIDKIDKEIKSLKEKIANQELPLSQLNRKINNHNSTITGLMHYLAIIQHQASINELKAISEKNTDIINDTEEELRRLGKHSARLTAEIKTLEKNASFNQDYHSSAQHSEYSSKINQKNTDGSYSSALNQSQSSQLLRLKAQKKSLKANIKTKQRQLDALKQKIVNSDCEIFKLERELQQFSHDEIRLARLENLTSLKNKILEQKEELASTENEKLPLELAINQDKSALLTLEKVLEAQKQALDFYKKITGGYSAETNTATLTHLLEEQNKIRSPYLDAKGSVNNQIYKTTNQIKSLNSNCNLLQKQLENLRNNHLLSKLWNNPEALLSELIGTINEKIAMFEQDHPFKQSKETQLAIANIVNQLGWIINNNTHITDPELIVEGNQEKYYQVCGLLYEQLGCLSGQDTQLSDLLYSVLKTHAIDKAFALQQYKKLSLQAYSGYEELQKKVLIPAYESTRDRLKALLSRLSDSEYREDNALYKTGLAFIASIEAKRMQPDSAAHFDFKYYNQFLQSAEDLTKHPDDPKTIEGFDRLKNHNADGKPSLGSRICGAATMFLGAAVIIGSLMACLTSLPLALVGIGGLHLGIVICGLGAHFYRKGISRGDYKGADNFAAAAKHARFFSSSIPERKLNDNKSNKLLAHI